MAGVAVLWYARPVSKEFTYRKVAEARAGAPGFPDLGGRFPAERLSRYLIEQPGASPLSLQVAAYRNARGEERRALLYLGQAGEASPSPLPRKSDESRQRFWGEAAKRILEHTREDSLFLGWWDDAQRIDFLTGRETWVTGPVADAFPDGAQRRFWEEAAGGFGADGERLRQLARWLTMDADAASREMAGRLPKDRPIYWLICLDDLARIDEIERLAGVHLPFEARIFPPGSDIHAQIAAVKQWSGESGYFVQELPDGGLWAWRTTSKEGGATLFARLLPFTTSLAGLPESVQMVYQSAWGGYLAVFRWRNPAEGTERAGGGG